MNYINKKAGVILLPVLTAVLLSGCGKQNITMPYDTGYPVSSFQLTSIVPDEFAKPFANDYCITSQDVLEGKEVDMEKAGAAGLFDLKNRNVLYAKNVHEKLHPASLTKVMTALVAYKYGKMEDMLTVSHPITFNESQVTVCGLKEGDTLTLDQAMHALLLHSANDAAVVIAEHIGGSVEGFAELMNQEALSLGASNSHFVNPHGLTDDNHYTTAYDLYLIFNAALKQDERFSEIIRMNTYSTVFHDKNGAEKEFNFTNTNQYLKGTYQPPDKVTVLGGKTGTTSAARNCLILSVKDSAGTPYISVILRSEDRGILYEQMTDLLDEIQK